MEYEIVTLEEKLQQVYQHVQTIPLLTWELLSADCGVVFITRVSTLLFPAR